MDFHAFHFSQDDIYALFIKLHKCVVIFLIKILTTWTGLILFSCHNIFTYRLGKKCPCINISIYVAVSAPTRMFQSNMTSQCIYSSSCIHELRLEWPQDMQLHVYCVKKVIVCTVSIIRLSNIKKFHPIQTNV